MRLLREQRGGSHDHSALAVAALRHLVRDPRLLQRVRPISRKTFDGRDVMTRSRAQRERARSQWPAIHVHGTRAARRDSAAVLRSSEAGVLSNHPQQRRFFVGVDREMSIVDV